MSEATQTVLDAALKLSEAERTEVAIRLLESLPDDEGLAMDDEDLLEELEARRKDTSGSIPWSQLKAEFP